MARLTMGIYKAPEINAIQPENVSDFLTHFTI